jgi:hypothetical protein
MGDILGIGAAVGGIASGAGALFGAQTQASAEQQAIQTQQQMFQEQINLEQPWRQAGRYGLNALSNLEGLGPYGPLKSSQDIYNRTPFTTLAGSSILPPALSPSSWARRPNGSSGYPLPLQNALANFKGSPDYQFLLGQGNLANNQALAATGQLGSGGQLRGAQQFGQGLASTDYQNFFNNLITGQNTAQQEYQNYFGNAVNINAINQSNYQNYFNRLSTIAGYGQNATGNLVTAAGNTGSNISSLQAAQGNALAAGFTGVGNAAAGTFNNLALYSLLGQQGSNSSFTNALNISPYFSGNVTGSNQLGTTPYNGGQGY